MWLHEALLGRATVAEFLRDAAYRAWQCPGCGAVNEDVGEAAHAPEKCRRCHRSPSAGRALRVVNVDRERRTITVSG